MRPILLAAVLTSTLLLGACATAPSSDRPSMAGNGLGAALDDAIAGSWRTPANVARDRYRHPKQTLAFFGVRSDQTVIEIMPPPGWYAEILAPYLRENGHYIAAVVDPASQSNDKARNYYAGNRDELQRRFDADPAHFDRARIVGFDPKNPVFGPSNSADVVLTFRNVHNWRMAGTAPGMFKGFFDVLKPGGVLGLVEHRAKADVADDDKTGYVGQAQVIAMAQAAGFLFDGSSEVNANPLDTKDYPGGVWTLPPTNQHDAKDDAKYKAIGESDRMTLRFVKPRG
ncbi:class I SAM-dependent methyltransferase [Cognatilysobacter lacus]|uniref:Class I SAM-dependent methyltransferase n=1 Tax=Cognatilysobacter lacus TaxID=1643323 RepID=A0A5D8Z581_9GAMM|nr:class I SAM-dependent methyltransferase [Lysobacter lacus]